MCPSWSSVWLNANRVDLLYNVSTLRGVPGLNRWVLRWITEPVNLNRIMPT